MKRQLTFLTITAAASLMMASAQAEEIGIFEHACSVDGSDPFSDPLPAQITSDGVGGTLGGQQSLEVTVSGAGAHTVICFFDAEIDEAVNTYFNEEAETGGALAAGQSWEIDEPGFVFGDIFDNMADGALDNANDIDGFGEDVSMAIGFDFVLAAGETGVVSFFLDLVNNAPGFFIRHFDPDSIMAFDLGSNDPNFLDNPNQLFFWGDLDIQGGGGPMPVPEPGTIGLLGLGLMGIAGMRRRRKSQ